VEVCRSISTRVKRKRTIDLGQVSRASLTTSLANSLSRSRSLGSPRALAGPRRLEGASDGAVDLGIVKFKSSRIVRKDLPSTRGSQDGQVLRQLDKVRDPSGHTTLRQSWTEAVRTSSLTILRCLENSSRHILDPTNRIIYHLRSLNSTVNLHRNVERICGSIGRLYCVGNKFCWTRTDGYRH
jgi:hypothetical protein